MEQLKTSVWGFFTNFNPKNTMDTVEEMWDATLQKRRPMTDNDWKWILQSDKVKERDDVTIESADQNQITVSTTIGDRAYSLAFRRTDGFPEEAPTLEGEFIRGFTFGWNGNESSINDLVEECVEYLRKVDVTLRYLKGCNTFDIVIKSIEEDDEEPGCLRAELGLEGSECNEVITLVVDTEDPLAFPRVIRSSNPERFSGVDCEMWDADRPLVANIEAFIVNADY